MLTPIENEFINADLGDVRRLKSMKRIVRSWSRDPSASFPRMVQSPAELQALYDFMGNEEVCADTLLASHSGETLRRIDEKNLPLVCVVHDSSEISYGGESVREGVGYNGHRLQGYLLHLALAVSADGKRHPLGVLGMETLHREQEPKRPRGKAVGKKWSGRESAKNADRESLRWAALMKKTSDSLRGHAVAIHVADREAESYEFLLSMLESNERFVVRARVRNRNVLAPPDDKKSKQPLVVAVKRAVPVAEREVTLSRRKKSPFPKQNKTYPPRKERETRLEFAAQRVAFLRPEYMSKTAPDTCEINVVHVRELDTPEGVEPIEWLLLTNEPIETAEDVLRVVDIYRTRWVIEEFFKALKTGCSIEKRQLEDFHALKIALVLAIPMAWQMLLLRTLAQENPDALATTAMPQERIDVVNMLAWKKLPSEATVGQLFRAIAMLGGYLDRKGRHPGWQTLGRGLEKVYDAENVIKKALESDEMMRKIAQRARSAKPS